MATRSCQIILAIFLPIFVSSFSTTLHGFENRQAKHVLTKLYVNKKPDTVVDLVASRRDLLQSIASIVGWGSILTLSQPQFAYADSPKILVLGGTGFVGSRIVEKLKEKGIQVVVTSRDGRGGTVAFDVLAPGMDVERYIETLAKGSFAVISTIGTIGTASDDTVNAASGLAAMGAKKAGVERFVYIGVAPEVKEFAKDIDFFKKYMIGKTFATNLIKSTFPESYTLIEPTFIYGGEEFKTNPPRVAGFYGSAIEGLLSSAPLRALSSVAPGGFAKVAMEPPVSVDAVADAAVAGALGKAALVLDTYDKINEAAASP